MTRTVMSYAAAAALALGLASPAFAEDSGSTTGTTGAPSFSEADTNQDGFIDSTELQTSTGSSDSVAIYDTDGDGMLSEEEYSGMAMGSSESGSTLDSTGSSTDDSTDTSTQ